MTDVSHTKFPADSSAAGTSVGIYHFAEDLPVDLLSYTIFLFS